LQEHSTFSKFIDKEREKNANTISQKKVAAPKSLSPKELQDARQVINIFLLAWKNFGLYPEEHAASRKAIQNLVSTFDNFFSTHGDLRLTVKKRSSPLQV
jgi:hypothetical protein